MFTLVLLVCAVIAMSLMLGYPLLINRRMREAKRKAEIVKILGSDPLPNENQKTWIEEELEKRRPKPEEELEKRRPKPDEEV